MALLYMLLVVALTWSLGALQLWPPMRWVRELPLWLGGALAVGVAACVAWGFVGVLRYADWQALTMDQAVELLVARAAKGGGKAPVKKAPVKKSATKKPAAKKAPAKAKE